MRDQKYPQRDNVHLTLRKLWMVIARFPEVLLHAVLCVEDDLDTDAIVRRLNWTLDRVHVHVTSVNIGCIKGACSSVLNPPGTRARVSGLARARTHTHVHTYTQARAHTRTHARTHTHTHAHTHACTHTHSSTHTCTHTHTHTHARTHARTRARVFWGECSTQTKLTNKQKENGKIENRK